MINLLHLALLTLLNEARVAHIDQTLPESHGDKLVLMGVWSSVQNQKASSGGSQW
jgi:hypothetical protein